MVRAAGVALVVVLAVGVGVLAGTAHEATARPAVADTASTPVPAGASTAPSAEQSVPDAVVLYGDSLAWESQEHFRAALEDAGVDQVITRTFGGTAICDWLDQMRADAALQPDVVVVEFSGNALTPCMHDGDAPLDSDAVVAKYAADAAAVVDAFAPAGSDVRFVGSPSGLDGSRNTTTARINAIYAAIAAAEPTVRYRDAGAAVLDNHRWARGLPCLANEPCTGGRDEAGRGVNAVRAPDGLHFCPRAPSAVDGRTATCAVWSSGAYRFGIAMATAALDH
jgi:hypothetical protein